MDSLKRRSNTDIGDDEVAMKIPKMEQIQLPTENDQKEIDNQGQYKIYIFKRTVTFLFMP